MDQKKKELAPIEAKMPEVGGAGAIETNRAIAEVQGMIVMAKRFPRDIDVVKKKIEDLCKSPGLAKEGRYAYNRGKEAVTGLSVRAAKAMAQAYGNMKIGVKEIEQRKGESVMMSYCWDIENNLYEERTFTVVHEIDLKHGKKKKLTSGRDIYENNANLGSRRLRACILDVIPREIREIAEKGIQETEERRQGLVPIEKRVKNTIAEFEKYGITEEMLIKKYDDTPLIDLTTKSFVSMGAILNTLRDNMAHPSAFFPGIKKPEGSNAQKMNRSKDE